MIIGKPPKLRAVFISDVHLGSPHAQVGRLLAFLKLYEFDLLCLVGDTFDSLGVVLPVEHTQIVTYILELIHSGVKVIFIPGNHDHQFGKVVGDYKGMLVEPCYVHITAAGRTILVSHGDQWDWLASGPLMHAIDRKLPLPFWEYIRKYLPRTMARHLKSFEKRALAARAGHDSVLCGHSHMPAIRGNYLNTGDWVKHCSAIVEHEDGEMELVYG